MAIRGGQEVIEGQRVPNGFEQITGLSSVQQLTVPAGTRLCFIQADGGSVRWRDDGTNPTPTVGMIMTDNSILVYNAAGETNPFTAIRFIEVSTTSKLNVSYYK